MSEHDLEVLRLADEWYDTGVGKGDVEHRLALAILRRRLEAKSKQQQPMRNRVETGEWDRW